MDLTTTLEGRSKEKRSKSRRCLIFSTERFCIFKVTDGKFMVSIALRNRILGKIITGLT